MNASAGLGILVAGLATTSYNVGLIVEKRALAQMPPIDARHAVSLAKTVLFSPVWLGGFALMLCGFGLQVVALMLAPVSVVQPVLGSGVVILVLLSRLVLRERLGRVEFGCVLAVAVAIAAIALSAAGSAGKVGHEASGLLIAVVAVPACVIALVLGASALRPVSGGKHRLPAVGVSYGLAAGLAGSRSANSQVPATMKKMLPVILDTGPTMATRQRCRPVWKISSATPEQATVR